MRVAVISDIHGNHHALRAVLDAIGDQRPDAIWCLGDLVGYGPKPNECCATVARSARICLVGNHDLGVIGRIDLADFSPDAHAAAEWSREVLTQESRTYLEGRKTSTKAHRSELFHASPRDPVWEYVLSAEAAYLSLLTASAPLVLVGHSHVALAIGLDDTELRGGLAPSGTEVQLDGRWLINPGSVGQPRDGDPDAAWLELDTDEQVARFRRVAYPIERTQAGIREQGLPEPLAERLAHGV
jgi:predicted phosphodiesterase